MSWDWKALVKPIADKIVYASEPYVSLKSSVNDFAGSLIDFSRGPAGAGDEALVEAARYLRPWTAEGLVLVRVGGDSDGGYVMADGDSSRHAVSIGVGRDISWDAAMAERGVRVHAFDHTVRGLPQTTTGVSFHKVGLGQAPGCQPLETLVEMSVGDAQSVLKVDIEGAERDALAGTDLHQFTQILLEIHGFDEVNTDGRIKALLQHLNRTHVPVHVHANNYDSVFRFENLWFCSTLEATFVRKDLYQEWVPARTLLTNLDRPCDPRTSDISLAGILALDPAEI